MAYVYKHIRKDTGDIFYIGIGKSDNNFKRAHSKDKRNIIWKRIVEKTDYDVEVIHSNITWQEACSIEKELILKYKKRNQGGTLCNISDGGEGGILSEEVQAILKEKRQGHKNPKAKKVYQYTLDGEFVKEWECIKYASDYYNIGHVNITHCFSGKQKTAAGFKWSKTKLHED